MQMKKRVLSVLLALCLAGSLASTAWAAGDQATPETAEADTSAVVLNEEEEQQDETTASQEETSGEDSTVAPAEDPVAQVTETEADDGSVEYTAALETDGQTMNVVVTAPEGAFAEDVQPELSVTMLTAEDELNAVADELDAAEVAYDGFAALDITFTDKATGEEIEPVQQVSVRIELPQTIVDSGIDLNTLAVQHLEEDADGNVQNVTEVATLDNGITLSEEAAAAANEAAGVAPMSDLPAEEATAGDATETPAAVAEFDVDGFSSFVITWQADWHSDGTIRVTYWNTEEDGSELTVPNQYVFNIGELNDGDTITLQNGKLIVKGKKYEIPQQVTVGNDTYKYIGAKCYYNKQWQDFATIQLKIPDYYIGWDYKVDGNDSDSKPDVRLLYEKVPTDPGSGGDQGGTGTTSTTVTTGKSAVKIGDTDNYTLNLSVSGDRGSQTQKQAVDVLFIIDRSASMEKSLGGWQTKIGAVKSAVSTLVNSINDPQDSIEVRYSAIRFSNANGTRTVGNGWYSENNASNFISQINAITTNEGTNWEAGIHKAIETLDGSDRPNATKIVVFLSDGVPTYSGGFNWESEHGDGSDHASSRYGQSEETISGFADDAAKEIEKLDCDYFFAIGIGSDFNLGNRGRTYMTRLTDHVQAGIPTRVLSANNETDLESAFNMIEEATRFFAANNVVMVDPMSEYADLVPVSGGSNNGQYEFTLALEKKASAEEDYLPVQGASQTVYVTANSNQGTTVTLQDGTEQVPITVFVDKDDSTGKETIRVVFGKTSDGKLYELAQNYRYTVSTVITPSQKAITEGKDQYNGEGEANTGTHAGADGFWSNDNDNALVNYNAITTDENGNITDSTPGTPVYFPKPVIQVPEKTTVDLTLEKTFVGLTDAEVEYLIFRDDGFGFDVNYCVSEARPEDPEQPEKNMTFMAPDADIKGLYLPDGTEISSLNNGGGGYRIVAGDYLVQNQWHNESKGTYDTDYTNPQTGASLKKENGNWVYSITLTVPKCDENHFFTVFEQHQEVPGYAKINDSNAEWTITGLESTPITGTGKFIEGNRNVYEDMNELGEKKDYREQEDYAIAQGALRKLTITEDTTIAFTNYYTGKLDVTKTIGDGNEYDGAQNQSYALTIAPAHLWKLDFDENATDSTQAEDITHGLAGKTVSYYITSGENSDRVDENGTQLEENGTATKTLGADGAFTINIKPDQTIYFIDLPAIQWQVAENTESAQVDNYTLTATVTDTNNNVVDDGTHWNQYTASDTIGSVYQNDGIASVDSARHDQVKIENVTDAVHADAVALVTVTNVYTRDTVTLTVSKFVRGNLSSGKDTFEFTLELKNDGAAYTQSLSFEKYDADAEEPNKTTNGDLFAQSDGEYAKMYTFSLSGQDYIEFTVPKGCTYTVTEVNDGDYDQTFVGTTEITEGNGTNESEEPAAMSGTANAEENSVAFTNVKSITGPVTGLNRNDTPYTILITVAGIAGLALIGGIVARRVRRRRME